MPIEITAGYTRRAAFYRVEYDEMRDVPYFLSLIEADKTEVLEVPCGAGRLTVHLARKAKHVTAIDIEPVMVTSLLDYMETEGLADRVDASVGDMTDLHLSSPVDLIIVPSEALQLLPKEEGRKAVTSLVAQLKPGGRLVVDIATFCGLEAGMPDYFDPATRGESWHPQWIRPLPGGGTLKRSVRYLREYDRCVFEFLYVLSEKGSLAVTFSEEMALFFYEAEWFLQNLPQSVAELSFKSSYDNTHDIPRSHRLIVTMRKTVDGTKL